MTNASKFAPVDGNHTHFVVVEHKQNADFYDEINFRNKFETELRKTELDPSMMKRDISNAVGSLQGSNVGSDDEMEVDKKFNIPMIQICVHGNFETLYVLQESLKQRVPILILAGSRGCSDLIENAMLSDKSKLT